MFPKRRVQKSLQNSSGRPNCSSSASRVSSRTQPEPCQSPTIKRECNVLEDDLPLSLRLSIDFGTDQIKIAYLLPHGTDRPNLADVKPVRFLNGSEQAPAGIAIDLNNKLYWGFEAQRLVQEDKISEERYIRLIKMAIWEPSSIIGRQALARLARVGQTLDQVLEQCFREFVAHAKACAKEAHLPPLSLAIERMPVEAFICVPQLWNAKARYRLLTAANKAGIDKVRPVFEPECAAAFAIEYRKAHLRLHDTIIVCDVGGGTGDFISLRIMSPPSNGFRTRVNVLGKPQGALCGSHCINQKFLTWLDRTGNVTTWVRQLGISIENFHGQATEGFENRKKTFTRLNEPAPTSAFMALTHRGRRVQDESINIAGMQYAERQGIRVPVKYQVIKQCFDEVVEQILAHVRLQIGYLGRHPGDSNRVIIELPGGMGNSDYLRERLDAEFVSSPGRYNITVLPKDVGKDNSICKGALMRFSNVEMKSAPLGVQFGIAWEEPWRAKLHKDATIVTRHRDTARGRFRQWSIPHPDKTRLSSKLGGNERVVDDRLRWIFKMQQRVDDDGVYELKDWQVHLPARGGPEHARTPVELSQTIYCTDQAIAEHESLYAVDGSQRPDVYEWVTLSMKVEDPEERFSVVPGDDGEPCFLVYTQIVARCRGGADIEFAWRVGSEEQWIARGVADVPQSEWTRPVVVCSQGCNPFTVGNGG